MDGYRAHNSGLEDVSAWLERIGMLEQTDEQQDTETGLTKSEADIADTDPEVSELSNVTEGTEAYRDFVIDNVYHSEDAGDINYNVYIPESYDGSKPYDLYFTLPGYEGLYFQGVAANIE